ncbi:MAG: hypothetical protein II007_02905 [Gammaproteobacteria bacterium]|nr:hypothetical protein [Gammaproteobacteria bacterium]
MATSVRLDDSFVQDVKVHADALSRSLPKQIEHWAKIGQIVEENPDLSYAFIKEVLLAKSEVQQGLVTRYERRTKRD